MHRNDDLTNAFNAMNLSDETQSQSDEMETVITEMQHLNPPQPTEELNHYGSMIDFFKKAQNADEKKNESSEFNFKQGK